MGLMDVVGVLFVVLIVRLIKESESRRIPRVELLRGAGSELLAPQRLLRACGGVTVAIDKHRAEVRVCGCGCAQCEVEAEWLRRSLRVS